jgi:hypothetical protein
MYSAGEAYKAGWQDRYTGSPAKFERTDLLLQEYMQGYNDCHQHIIETARREKTQGPLFGHPLYKEAHEQSNKQFLSD